MDRLRSLFFALTAGSLLLPMAWAAAPPDASSPSMKLTQGWAIQSSADVHESGAAISAVGFDASQWYPATVPSTVLSALVEQHVYPDPYVGMNLRSIPGTSYPIFANFSELRMPPDSPFRHSWWYRTEFKLPGEYKGKTLSLGFDGINYRANVWLNGRQIASADKMAGTWRLFEFDVTAAARPGELNALAVEVFPPQKSDLAITLVDWGPMPPDKEMGIWRDVHITATGPAVVRYPAVLTKLNLPSTDQAELTVRAEVKNLTDQPVEGVLKGKVEAIEFSQPVKLAAHETQMVRFTPEKFAQLKVANPRLWWPAQLGPQNLYPLDLEFVVEGQVSDFSHIRFGIRQVTSEVDAAKHHVFQINGRNILIRGAGYSFDMLLRSSPERQEAELRYVRDMNLNTIRFEGKLEDDHFFDLMDEMGILAMPGWCCCDNWERWPTWSGEDEPIAVASLRDQIRRLERHPSVFTFLYGSDRTPPPEVEKKYLQVLKESDWPNPAVASAGEYNTTVGPTGVKMLAPYEWVAPVYWEIDTKRGGAFGFATEISPGPAIPPIESLRRMLPEDHLWPIDSVWEYHAGGMSKTLKIFTEALDKRYGPSHSVEEYAQKAQMQAYEGHRAMMEAYGRNKYTSTGVIQWMLNNTWPSMIWHLYDWYMRPGGSYYGVKHACEPLHVQYSYDDRSVVVVNSYYRAFPSLKVTAKVYGLDMTEKYSKEATLAVGEDSSTRVFTLPEITGLSGMYFVDLRLENGERLESRNFYWLPNQAETVDFENEPGSGVWTPTKLFADYTALNSLPPVDLEVKAERKTEGAQETMTVTLHNPSRALAFGVRLKVKKIGKNITGAYWYESHVDDEVLPSIWEDNYFALLPGETRQITATYNTKDLGGNAPGVEVSGWNVNWKEARP
ncbi:MAG: sugar-binding domain-containing protein [Terracidiphilus sp.]